MIDGWVIVCVLLKLLGLFLVYYDLVVDGVVDIMYGLYFFIKDDWFLCLCIG